VVGAGDWYHGNSHGNVDQGWSNHPAAWGWGAGLATGAAITSPWSWGYFGYSNPYSSGTEDSTTYMDYSQPLVAAAPADSTQQPSAAGQASPQDEAVAPFDEARNLFSNGDFKGALDRVNTAIQKAPNDTALHEFRGLCQFALGQYKPAAATLYAVLSVGPGWDWTTLSGLYPNVDAYTAQLRALEKYATDHPDSSDTHFVLAYHYLTAGNSEAAAREYKMVIQLNPKDDLSKQLLASLTGSGAEPSKPSEPATPSKPVEAAAIVGNWKASRPDGSSINLKLAEDKKYSWKYTTGGKTQDFEGVYTLADNVLILKQNEQPMMVGQISLLAANQLNFKLTGGDPSDPGLTFSQ
jgi:tetratricopeptide (TPR) repeat protein